MNTNELENERDDESLAALKIRLEMQKIALEMQKHGAEMEAKKRSEEMLHEIRMLELRGTSVSSNNVNTGRREGVHEKINIPKIDDSSNPQDILTAFEKMCKLYEVPIESWNTLLLPSLSGKALRAYSQVPEEQGRNYEYVKSEILKAFGLTCDQYRKRFRTAIKRPRETYVQLLTRMSGDFDQWAKGSEVEGSYEKLRELIIKEQFNEILPNDLRIWIADRNIGEVNEIAASSDRYDQARVGRTVEKREKAYLKPEYKLANRQISTRRETIRPRRENNWNQHPSGIKDDVVCFRCKGRGHFASQCSSKEPRKESTETQAKKVYFVAMSNVKLPAEYLRKIIVNGKTITALRDTGAFISIVDENLVEEGQLTGEHVEITTVANEVKCVPTAKIRLLMDGREENVTAAVLPNLPVELIVGNTEGELLRQEIPGYECNANMEMNRKMYALTAQNYEQALVVNGKYIRVLRDTGANLSLVRKNMIERRNYTGKTVKIRTITGKEQIFPMAKVRLEIGGEVHNVTMAVATDRLPYPIILGNDHGPVMAPIWNCIAIASADGEGATSRAVRSGGNRKRRNPEKGAIHKLQTKSKENGGERPMTRARTRDMLLDKVQGKDKQEIQGDENKGEEIAESMPADLDACLDAVASKEDLIELQRTDESLQGVREKLDKESTELGEDHAKFIMKEGIIVRKWYSHKRQRTWEQLVIPKTLREPLMHLAHETLLAAHKGITKTRNRLLQSVYWPGIFSDVAEYVNSCATCQVTNKPGAGLKAPLHPIPEIEEPFFKLGMYLIGPLQATEKGNKYILTVIDYASRYPEAEPLPSIEASTVVEALVKMFTRTGFPSEIVSDQGTQFMAAITQGLWRRTGVKINRSSPYKPSTNGLVERTNSTLKSMLRSIVEQYKENWDELIPYALFAYREVPNESTGFSPFELIYGRDVRGPIELLRRSWTGQGGEKQAVTTYLKDLRTKMAQTAKIAVRNLKAAQTTQKTWYDRTARKRRLEVGTETLVLRPIRGDALEVSWDGPFPITRKISDLNYEVEVANGKKKIYHINMLKPFKKRAALVGMTMGREDSLEEDTDEHLTFPVGGTMTERPHMGKALTEAQKSELGELLTEYDKVLRETPGRTHMETHDIKLTDDTPVCVKQYRNPWAVREEIERQVEEMLKLGIVEHSRSSYSSPVVLVPKKSGESRFCIDYRRLNSLSRLDPFPAPSLEDSIAGLGRARYLTKIDLVRGYWQIPLEDTAKEKTAFRTESGLYQFTVLPFGLKNSSAAFVRLMDKVLKNMQSFTKCYIDDILIHSDDWDSHVQHIAKVLKRLEEAGLTAKPGKCHFGMASLAYLGHEIGPMGITPDEAKVKAIKEWPQPTTKRQVRAFLGVTGYYRRFIPSYAAIAAPLTKLTRKAEPNRVRWDDECEGAFNELKDKLITRPVLKSADDQGKFVLQTDASDRGLGVVLSQECPETGDEHPVAYMSRKLTPAEQS